MLFFETTPVGRLINRFSKDVDLIDTRIPKSFEMWYYATFRILSTVFVISYATPLFMVILLPLAIFYFCVQVQKKHLHIYLLSLMLWRAGVYIM